VALSLTVLGGTRLRPIFIHRFTHNHSWLLQALLF
jgi:hypothetical protein